MIRRYCPAIKNKFSGVLRSTKIGEVKIMPKIANKIKIPPNKTTKDDMVAFSFCFSPMPYCCAAKIDSPEVNPIIIVINRLYIAVVAPIAAREISPSTFPTIKASTQLNIC